MDRISEVTGVPFHFPQEFPVLTVLPMRVLTALQIHEADKYEQCVDKVRQKYVFSLVELVRDQSVKAVQEPTIN